MNEVLSFVAGGTSGKLSNETSSLLSHSLLDNAPKIPALLKLQINTGPTRTDLNVSHHQSGHTLQLLTKGKIHQNRLMKHYLKREETFWAKKLKLGQ